MVVSDFVADNDSSVSIRTGEVVYVDEKSDTGWYFVKKLDGTEGWAPSDYLKPAGGGSVKPTPAAKKPVVKDKPSVSKPCVLGLERKGGENAILVNPVSLSLQGAEGQRVRGAGGLQSLWHRGSQPQGRRRGGGAGQDGGLVVLPQEGQGRGLVRSRLSVGEVLLCWLNDSFPIPPSSRAPADFLSKNA